MLTTTRRATMLAQFISNYMNDDTNIHNNLTFMMDAIVTRSLLKDPEEENEELTATRRKWTIRLNSLIQSKQQTARWAAIILIKLTCDQSPALLFGNIRSWTGQLLGLIAKPDTSMVHKAAIETLSGLFVYTSNKPELLREITNPNISRFNQTVLGLCKSADLLLVGLSALKTSFIHFPSQARHVTDQCLKLCLTCLDGSVIMDEHTILAACQCLVASHHTAGKQNNADPWKDTLLHLIGSVHKSLDRLFDTIDEELESSERLPSYPLSDYSPDPLESFPLIVRRIQSLNTAIATCLGSPTSIVVSVPIVELVDLACRVYNVFDGSLMREFKDKSEFTCLMSCLPTLHLSANKVITALLLSSGNHLSSYSKLFSRILIRLLNEYSSQRTIKISVYRIISLCLQQFGYMFGELVCKPLVASIIEDIQVTEQKVTDVAPTPIKNKSMKRKRDTLTNSDLLVTAGLSTQGPHDIQIAALDSLQDLLTCFGSTMDMNSRNTVDGKVLNRLLLFTQKPLESITESDTLIKEKLYQCLLASVMNPIEVQASILPHALRLFSAGLNEQNHQLQAICKQGLAICNLISHPRMPPIQSSANTFSAKLKQAAEEETKTSNIPSSALTSHYPATESILSATLPSANHTNDKILTASSSSSTFISASSTDAIQTNEDITSNHDGTGDGKSSVMEQLNADPLEGSMKAHDGKLSNNTTVTTASTITTSTNKIQLDDDDDDDDNEDEVMAEGDNTTVMDEERTTQTATTTTTTTINTAITAPTDETDETDEKDDINIAIATPAKTTAAVAADAESSKQTPTLTNDIQPLSELALDEVDDLLDGELVLPDIDMTGPDTEDEDELSLGVL